VRVTEIVRTDSQSQRLESFLTRPGDSRAAAAAGSPAAFSSSPRKRKFVAGPAEAAADILVDAGAREALLTASSPLADAAAGLLADALQAGDAGALGPCMDLCYT
jgi:hypothetical protein